MERKGQAAMEFLLTYGWAILAAIIVIGALAYFGVFSPSKIAPSACVLNAPLSCEEYKVNTTGVYVNVRNGAGMDIIINSVSLNTTGNTNICGTFGNSTTTIPANGPTVYVTDGALSGALNSTCTGLTLGSRFKGTLTVSYTQVGGTLSLASTGSISGTVASN